MNTKSSLLLLAATIASRRNARAFLPPASPASARALAPRVPLPRPSDSERTTSRGSAPTDDDVESAAAAAPPAVPAPTLNGKVVLPMKAMTAGLKGHKVAAVYAILTSDYKRGSGEGWEHVKHVDITRDLGPDLANFLSEQGPENVAHVRALSFSYPQKATMQDFANGWMARVMEAGGTLGWPEKEVAAEGQNMMIVGDDYEMDDDDDDDDDIDHEDYLEMMAASRAATSPPPPAPLFVDNTGLTSINSLAPEPAAEEAEEIVSPFEKATDTAIAHLSEETLELNAENVDKVLDEVRPYLISDGGNVSVRSVDVDTGNVYLLLEGACGSCASSTVTMQMGIERVLREKFGDALGEVAQVDPDEGSDANPTELTVEAVQAEVNRMSQAITAMGGVVRVVRVDPIGEVEVEYRGPNRVRKGLEMALLDVEYVKHVKFVS